MRSTPTSRRIRRVLASAAALTLAVGALAATGAVPASAAGGTFRNPISTQPDPFVSFTNGRYYAVENGANETQLFVRSATSLAGLLTAAPQLVWSDSNTTRNKQVWAPSFVNLNDHWYLYYTASDGVDANHRNYVLESQGLVSQGATPAGPYNFKARIFDPANDTWAIDGLPFSHNGQLYFAYSGQQGGATNNMFVARMSNPFTLNSARTFLPAAGGCTGIREAPALVNRNGRTWLVYSTCDTGTPDYQMWMMSLANTADPLVASNWLQRSGAVFSRNDGAGVYAPGSGNFFTSPDGTQDWFTYAAKNTTAFTYDNRTARAQRYTWNADGSPNFGTPSAAGATLALPSGDNGQTAYVNDTTTGFGSAGPIGAPGGLCVDVDTNTPTSGNKVQLYTCNGAQGQQWTVAADGTLRAFGKCMDIVGNSTADFAKMNLWDCNGVGGQQWRPQANGSLRNPQSGKCLDDPNGSTALGTQLQLYPCNNAAAQVFPVVRSSGQVSLSAGWTAGSTCGVQCFFGNDTYSGVTGATATYTFYGTRAALLSVKDSGNGIAAISVDGGPETLVDTYAAIRQGEQLQYVTPVLGASDHTLRIRVTGTKNGASGGFTLGVDRLEVYP